jgi:hypothetical protein
LSRSRTFQSIAATTVALSIASADLAAASEHDRSMMRVLACTGDQVSMEVYLPLEVALSDMPNMKPTYGYYTLDLSGPGKGKPLESVLVSISEDKKFVIGDQYTRKLKPTRSPIGGGTVDFDQRFGRHAKCGELSSKS